MELHLVFCFLFPIRLSRGVGTYYSGVAAHPYPASSSTQRAGTHTHARRKICERKYFLWNSKYNFNISQHYTENISIRQRTTSQLTTPAQPSPGSGCTGRRAGCRGTVCTGEICGGSSMGEEEGASSVATTNYYCSTLTQP